MAKRVSFAPSLKLDFYFIEPEPKELKWHNDEEYYNFGQVMLAEARRLRAVLERLPTGSSLLHDVYFECVGIEKYVWSRDSFVRTLELNRLHTQSIVESQNAYSSVILSAISKKSSLSNRMRAQRTARVYESI